VRELLDDSFRSRRALWLGWSLKREMALAHATDLDEQLADAIVVLGHAYKLIAWAPDNDLVGAADRLQRDARQTRQKASEQRRERGLEARKARAQTQKNKKLPRGADGTRREREDARRAVSIADLDPLKSPQQGEPTLGSSAAAVSTDAGDAGDAALGATHAAANLLRPSLGRRPVLPSTATRRPRRTSSTPSGQADAESSVEKGTRVRVLAGPFMNKVGIVQELDSKGRARVRLGLLAATLELSDLVATAEGIRPRLASSHRRLRSTK